MKSDQELRKQLIKLLEGDQSYRNMEKALRELPFELLGKKPDGFPYSIWQLVVHIHITQWDIIEFSKSENHKSPKWPEEYWKPETGPQDEKEWNLMLDKIEHYQQELKEMVLNEANDLLEPFSWGDGQNLFREVLVLAEHNAYHTGQIFLIKKLLMTGNF